MQVGRLEAVTAALVERQRLRDLEAAAGLNRTHSSASYSERSYARRRRAERDAKSVTSQEAYDALFRMPRYYEGQLVEWRRTRGENEIR